VHAVRLYSNVGAAGYDRGDAKHAAVGLWPGVIVSRFRLSRDDASGKLRW